MNKEDIFLDYRARAELLRIKSEQLRQDALDGQCDPGKAPELRVRIWEELHQVRLPANPSHAILAVIAEQTGLELPVVLEVQRLRAGS